MDETAALQKFIESVSALVVQHKTRISRLEVLASEEGVSIEDDENLDEDAGPRPIETHSLSDIKMLEKVTNWKIVEHSSKIKSLPDGKLLRQWSVSWQHIESSAMIVDEEIDEVIDANFDRNSSIISRLEIRLRLDNGDVSGLIENECSNLIEFCCQEKNSAVFFVHLTTYRNLYNDREDTITDLGFESIVVSNNSGHFVTVEIKNDESVLLATLCWWITFKHDLNRFVETYKAVLTDEGKTAGVDCGLPGQLLEEGHYEGWTAKECLANLKQMSTFA